ncbi:MAG TPA: GGDEF domain-containing response regulator [Acidimicrobiales bacterium]|nr:GGDEF domain-containing response regulator [Acidimicrobiales bacterium]
MDGSQDARAAASALRDQVAAKAGVIHAFALHLLDDLEDLSAGEVREHLQRIAANSGALVEASRRAADGGPPAPTPESGTPCADSDDWEGATRILLVDGHDDHAALVRSLLGRPGRTRTWEVVRVCSLREARRLAVDIDPACCLVDLDLPDASGRAVVQVLKELVRDRPIIAMTTVIDRQIEMDPLEIGVHDCLGSEALTGRVLERSIQRALEWSAADRQLSESALRDPLTGLANRSLLMHRIGHALNRLGRHRATVALVFIDLDAFKSVNDRHGHGVGDQLLLEVSRRLVATVRGDDLVARIGGDEFVVLCEDLHDARETAVLVERLVSTFAEPFRCQELILSISASLGVAWADGPGPSADALLAEADTAMYQAKHEGGGRCRMAEEQAAPAQTPSA